MEKGYHTEKAEHAARVEKVNAVIANSYGTTKYFRYMLGVLLTEGAKGVADAAGAYWLLDIVASYQTDPRIAARPFQLWTLTVNPDKSAVVTMKEDSDKSDIVSQEMPFTDFPLDKIELFLIDKVLMLPGEY